MTINSYDNWKELDNFMTMLAKRKNPNIVRWVEWSDIGAMMAICHICDLPVKETYPRITIDMCGSSVFNHGIKHIKETNLLPFA